MRLGAVRITTVTLTYHNVVRRWVKLGDWNGKSETFSVPLAELPKGEYSLKDIDRLDVVVQSGVAAKPGPILGTASTSCCTRFDKLTPDLFRQKNRAGC